MRGLTRRPSFFTALLPATFIVSALAGGGCSKSEPLPEVAPPAPVQTTGNDAAALQQAIANYRSGTSSEFQPFANVKLPETTGVAAPDVVFHTSLGDVKIRLESEKSPRTVAHFLSCVSRGHYTETIFHQVENGYVLVGGGFTAELVEKPTRYTVANEAANGLKNVKGTIAMARNPSDPNSGACQFIVNLADNPALDHRGPEPENYGYCVFGQVVEGFDVLEKIAAVPVRETKQFVHLPLEPVTIQTARVAYAGSQTAVNSNNAAPARGPNLQAELRR